MEYQVQFGTLQSPKQPAGDRKVFRIAVLGDFFGEREFGESRSRGGLGESKTLRANHENLDSLLQRLQVELQLPAGPSGATISVPIRSMDDFHPDQLYTNVPLFEKLLNLRQKLQDPSSFSKAAAAVLSLANDSAIPYKRIGKPRSATPYSRSYRELCRFDPSRNQGSGTADIKALLRDVVGTHVVPEMQGQAELLAAVDASLSDLMRNLLHHPDFQSMEGLWRSLDLLLHRLELDGELEVVLYDLSAAEFAADLAHCEDLQNTGLYHWFVETPSVDATQVAPSVIICNYMLELIPPHAEVMARACKIAAAAGASLLASVDRDCLSKRDPEEVHPLTKKAWDDLRSLPEAGYLGLTSPRFMLRWPYGKKTEPIDSFAFEEFTNQSGLSGMLWGNSAFLGGLLIALTFQNDGLAKMKLGTVLTVDDLPVYYYVDKDGDQIALPCTERLVNVATAQWVSSQGFIPVISMQGRPEARLGGLQSVQKTPLAGPWAPLQLSGSGMQTTPVTLPPTTAAESAPIPVPPETAASDASSTQDAAPAAEDELDQLLASLDDSSAPATDAPAEGDVDAELAALLADL